MLLLPVGRKEAEFTQGWDFFCVCVKHHFSTHELSMSVSIGEDEYFKFHPVCAPLQSGLKTGCD